MSRFKFRLQKVLDIRIGKEEESKRVFQNAHREKDLTEQKLKDLKEKLDKVRTINPKETLIEQKIKQIYINSLSLSVDNTKAELRDKIRILEEKREDLKNKQIERKTVETLKEKQLNQFNKEQDLIEQKSNDEFALYAFIRQLERR